MDMLLSKNKCVVCDDGDNKQAIDEVEPEKSEN